MKFIKKFENFETDETRGIVSDYPEINQANQLEAKKYVDSIFDSGSGSDLYQMCKDIGSKMPVTDDDVDELKKRAVEYFIENPEKMRGKNVKFSTYPISDSDRIPRTNNVGGTSGQSGSGLVNEKIKPSQNNPNSTKIDISSEEMKLFSTKSPLIGLIRNNKITLYENEVWFDKDDDKSISILSVYFDIPK